MIDTKYYSLLKVVETGSYTKAAKALSLSQPAVSQHIRLLEKELCIRIFERTRNQSRLTKEGKIVVKYVRRMVALQDLLERDLKNEKEKITSLTIGITHTAESNVIVEALAAYVSMNDGMNLKIVTDSTDQLYRMLKNYELDFALIEDRISDPSLNHILLDTDCLVLASVTAEWEYGRSLGFGRQLFRFNIEISLQKGILGNEFHLGILVRQAYGLVIINGNDIVFGDLIQVFPDVEGAVVVYVLLNGKIVCRIVFPRAALIDDPISLIILSLKYPYTQDMEEDFAI